MTIFLAGAHGVGKTYLAQRVASRVGLRHVTASDLIRVERGSATWTIDRRVRQADDNQEALIAAVARLSAPQVRLLLDGHFVLRGSDGEFIQVRVEVFARLQVRAAVLIEASHEVAAARLVKQRGADADACSVQQLASAERAHAARVCSALELPLVSLFSPSEDDLADALRKLVSQLWQS